MQHVPARKIPRNAVGTVPLTIYNRNNISSGIKYLLVLQRLLKILKLTGKCVKMGKVLFLTVLFAGLSQTAVSKKIQYIFKIAKV